MADFDLAAAIPVLARTPQAVRALLAGLPEEWIAAQDAPDDWSPYDVVGHLIHNERANWLPRVRMIIERGTSSVFEPLDRFAQVRASEGHSLDELLAEFAELRAASLRDLQALDLTPADLDRRGRHPEFGEVALRQLLATWVAHDLNHTVQIAEAMARQYRDAVGPWRAFLPVVEPA
jgi:hypothetical protein